MESFRATHFGPGPRLAGLAALLRTATGSPVPVISDLADGLALPAGTTTCLVLDLAAVPVDDLGLLRRLRARQPGLFVLWTGAASLASALPALADAGDEFRPWPLDVTLLPGFRAPAERAAHPAERAAHPAERAAHPAERAAHPVERAGNPFPRPANPAERAAGPAGDPLSAAHERAPATPPRNLAPPSAGGPSGPPSRALSEPVASALDPDLRHIEAILAGFERGSLAGTSSGAGPALKSTRSPHGGGPSAATTTPTTKRDDQGTYEDDDGDELGDVPDGERGELTTPFVNEGPLLTHAEIEAFLAPEPSVYDTLGLGDGESAAAGIGDAPNLAVRGLPHWYRDQVADLADLVQRAELALHAADSAEEHGRGLNSEHATILAGARLELGRLRQFARTLGCVAAPPAAGKTRMDLGVLVEEILASLAQRPAGAGNDVASGERVEARPRFLFRSQAGVSVQADKGLLVAALDAVLSVASAAAGAADVVRTEVLTTDAGVAEVRVDLPEGRLTGLEPSRIIEPYALRKRLPGIGAHALAAAGGILVGHGGDLVLERRLQGPNERARLVFSLRLPAR